jgi:outer membrane protein assembly factor BamB
MFRHDLYHTGLSPSPIAPETDAILWSYPLAQSKTANGVYGSAAVVGGKVYTTSGDGNLTALDINGTFLWRSPTFNYHGMSSSPTVANGKVFVGIDSQPRMYAFDANTGAKVWEYVDAVMMAGTYSSPLVTGGRVYFGTETQKVLALPENDPNGDGKIDSGEVIWSKAMPDKVWSTPAVVGSVLYIGVGDANSVGSNVFYALNASNGNTLWTYPTSGNIGDIVSSPSVYSGRVYFGATNGNAYALNATTGALVWNTPIGGPIWSSPAVGYGRMFIGANDNRLHVLDAGTGIEIWNYTTGDAVHSSPTLADGKVYFGSNDKYVYVLNATASTAKEIWKLEIAPGGGSNGVPASPTIYDGRMLIGGWDSVSPRLYCFGSLPASPTVKIDSPVGGESWSGGSDHIVRWTSASGAPPYTITLKYSTDGGASYSNVIASGIQQASAGTKDYAWKLPFVNSTSVRVRVELTDNKSRSASSASPVNLEIDSAPPSITATVPVDGAKNVSINTLVRMTFNESMNRTASEKAESISGVGNPALISPSWSGNELTFQTAGLQLGAKYTVTASTSAKDDSDPGNALANPYVFSFEISTIPIPTPPVILATSPANDSIDVPLTATIFVMFDKAMERTATEGAVTASPSLIWSAAWSKGDTTVTFTPSSGLQSSTKYSITITTSAKSVDGANLIKGYAFSFTTVAGAPPPTIESTLPSNGASNVPPNTNVTITFSEAMEKGATENAISSSPPISGTFTWDSSVRAVTWDPKTDLTANTAYSITISAAARSQVGVNMKAAYTFSFITGATVDTAPPKVVDTDPSSGQKDVDPSTRIIITFSEAMNESATASSVSISPGSIIKKEWNDNRTLMLTASFVGGTPHTVTVSTGAKDVAGNAMAQDYEFTFTTRSEPTNDPLQGMGTIIILLIVLIPVLVVVAIIVLLIARRKKRQRQESIVSNEQSGGPPPNQ